MRYDDLKPAILAYGFKPSEYEAVIIDGNNVVLQAVAGSQNPDERYPGVRGILDLLLGMYHIFGRNAAYGVCWDSGHDRERLREFPQYKKKDPNKKSSIDPELAADNCAVAQELLHDLPVLSFSNRSVPVEGDDLLFTVANSLLQDPDFGRILVITGDSDLLQLLSDRVHVYSPLKHTLYTKGLAQAHLGYPPERVPMAKAIAGDTSDAIPGVEGAGKKTAQEIVSRFETLDEFRAWAKSTQEKVSKKMLRVATCDKVDMYQRLTTLKTVPYEVKTSPGLNQDILGKSLESVGMRDLKTGLMAAFMGM